MHKFQPNWVIGVGAQKAGTTWLGNYLSNCSDIYFSPLKEMHFFDQIDIPRLTTPIQNRFQRELLSSQMESEQVALQERLNLSFDINKYIAFFERRWNGEIAISEITPSYAMMSTDAIKLMQSLPGTLKCFFILRNPVERVWSQIKMKASMFNQNLDPYTFIPKVQSTPDFFDRTDYISTIKRYQSEIGGRNFHIDFYENLFEKCPEHSLKSLCDFCGIEYVKADMSYKSNEGDQTAVLSDTQRLSLIKQLEPIYKGCEEYFGIESLPTDWQHDIARLNQT